MYQPGRPEDRIIVALDGLTVHQSMRAMEDLCEYVGMFKIGLGLITMGLAGTLLDFADKHEINIFYDAKFLDTPQTVATAATAVCSLTRASMFTLHCLGGPKMLESAIDAVNLTMSDVMAIGVTIPTSMGYGQAVKAGVCRPLDTECSGSRDAQGKRMRKRVRELATLALRGGLYGVVASGHEAEVIREDCGEDFLIITPGIRPQGARHDDQVRVMTPYQAVKNGADYLVIGRPIFKPKKGSSIDAVKRIADEISTV